MTITVKSKDICSVTSGIIVQGCNMQGKMNKGLAKQLRELYPENYNAYLKEHGTSNLILGNVLFHRVNDDLYIANAITQVFYGNNKDIVYCSYPAIQKAFSKIASFAKENNLVIHFPAIGAGLANGDWALIKEIIKTELKDVEKAIYYEYVERKYG